MSSDTTSSKILTDDYCKWHANLVLIYQLLRQIKFVLDYIKHIWKRLGLDPWIKSETFESSQINEVSTTKKDANNYISQDCRRERCND